MTEAEFHICTDPRPMLGFLREAKKLDARKLRLFAVACCRNIWDGLTDQRSKAAVEVAERFADGKATKDELLVAHDAAYIAVDDCLQSLISEDQAIAACGSAAADAEEAAWEAALHAWDGKDFKNASNHHAMLLREICGTFSFRSVTVEASWLTPRVVGLAHEIYDQRAFDRMKELGSALLQAGCENEEILGHCEQERQHCRGCWIVDLLTGRE